MPTINQLIRNGRKKQKKKLDRALQGGPQVGGVITRVFVLNPKKPNSAERVCARIRTSNGIEVTAYVPGEKNKLQEHQQVLIQGGRVKDLPGVNYHIVRGTRDVDGANGPSQSNGLTRRQKRSRYGVPKAAKAPPTTPSV